jgi:hypothetical protein
MACTDARSDYAVLELFCFFFLPMPVMQGMKKKERQELSVSKYIHNTLEVYSTSNTLHYAKHI